MKRVALYVRVSHEEQVKHGISVDAQKNALENYSKENDYSIVKIYADEGISARKSYKKRPALLEMISDCQKGKIDLILITKLDRFFRSVKDYYTVMEQIGEIPWKAIQEDYETETSAGVFKVNIMLSVAQSEADRTSERIKAVFDYKRSKGEPINGHASTGFIYKDGKFYKDPNTQEAVQTFFDTYLTTFSKKIALEKARSMGLHLSDETARSMLYGDNYYGAIPYIVDSYITEEQHKKILASKPKCTRQNSYNYIFSGLVRCGKCGRLAGSQTSINRRNPKGPLLYPMYVCDYGRRNFNCTGSTITEKRLEEFMLENLEKQLDDYNIKITLVPQTDNTDKIKRCNDRLERLRVLFEMGDIDIDEYKMKRNDLNLEIENYKSFECKRPIHLDSNWKEIYSSLDAIHKNSFWKQIIDHIEITEKKAKTATIFFK